MTSEKPQGIRFMIISGCLMLLTLLLSDTYLPIPNMTLNKKFWTVDVKVKDPGCFERNKPYMLLPQYRCERIGGLNYQIQTKSQSFLIYTKHVLSLSVIVLRMGRCDI